MLQEWKPEEPQEPEDDPFVPGFYFNFREQWSSFFTNCNWYDFTFVELTFEYDPGFGQVELTFMLLGVGFFASYQFFRGERMKEIKRQLRELGLDQPDD